MLRTSLAGLDRRKLCRWLILFFIALAVPSGLLVYHAYTQLKWEAFHQHRLLAEELAARITTRLSDLVEKEERQSFSDYSFLLVSGDESTNFFQRSPLAAYPVASDIPGLIGYFQVDTQGVFSTPLLPSDTGNISRYGITVSEFDQRTSIANSLQSILSQNQLADVGGRLEADVEVLAESIESASNDDLAAMSDAPEELSDVGRALNDVLVSSGASAPEDQRQVPAQEAFDRLKESKLDKDANKQLLQKSKKVAENLGRVDELKLDLKYQAKTENESRRENAPLPAAIESTTTASKGRSRIQQEQAVVPQTEPALASEVSGSALPQDFRIRTFESEIDAFEFSMLDSGHFVLFRKVWRDGERYVQGLLIEQQAFLNGVVDSLFRQTALARMSDLIVAYQGEVFSAFSAAQSRNYISRASELSGALLYQSRVSAPFSDLELIFSVKRLPAGPGASVIAWLSGILLLVLCGGMVLMYRLGGAQIDLSRQQQDFVSAVSHELKTPLTSIRMYGEMLREGWASDEKKKSYYEYIYDESERLSRLIENVLQLARMTRNDLQLDLKPMAVAELVDTIESKISTQVERAEFSLDLKCANDISDKKINVDVDCFVQIVINLVDNAIKFSNKSEQRKIDINCSMMSGNIVQFTVRDYGPGISKDQMKKIFKLFYRTESELTRETVGTGIGLALVNQLAQLMNAKVDVVNKQPGAEFSVFFPVA
ncbi:MAG: HAMP domain-containing histidine kinase [Gammaproteobacteria bacterium]|nr:HAMP domain-containing histidine kinase [Gammaproteobacteria bacterium]